MKKLLAVLLALTLVFALTACFAPDCTEHVDENNDGKCDVCDTPIEPDDGGDEEIMTHAEYVAAEDNAAVRLRPTFRLSSPGGKTRVPSIPRLPTVLTSSTICPAPRSSTTHSCPAPV